MNPFFKAMNPSAPMQQTQPMMGGPMANMGNVMQMYQQFRQTTSGDPQQMLNGLMQSGRINQDVLNRAQQMAHMFGML